MAGPVIEMTRSSQQLSFGDVFDKRPGHRLFFGIWPDPPAANRLTQLMARLSDDGIMSGKPVETHRLHTTLHHLGDFVDQIPPKLLPAAGKAAATVIWSPFEVVFDRVGGTRGAFLLRPSDRSATLQAFRQTLSVALIKAGLRQWIDTDFNPHVTLSYDFSDIPQQSVEPIGWTVRQFVLIESLLGQHQHIERGRWPTHA